MHVPSETELVEFRGWTLRVPRAEAEPRRLILLLHGWTGDENSMWVFARGLAADYWIVAPRAPYAMLPSGYSWRVVPPGAGEGAALEDLRSAANALIALVDDYCAENQIPGADFDVLGFSQGAALACALALLFPRRIAKVGVLAGFVPWGAEALTGGSPLNGKHFFVAHGSMDERVNIEHARRSVELLEAAGAHVTFCEAEVGHKVSAACLRGLQAFLLG